MHGRVLPEACAHVSGYGKRWFTAEGQRAAATGLVPPWRLVASWPAWATAAFIRGHDGQSLGRLCKFPKDR